MFTPEDLKNRTVAVLLGGKSAERDISLKTGTAVADALEARGYTVARIDVGDDVALRLADVAPTVAFVALHGRFGEDGCIQGLLECLGIPYTGAGVLASALAMDKVASKHLLRSVGLPTPAYVAIPQGREATVTAAEIPFGFPLVVKPAREGSSVGVTIVREESAFAEAVQLAASYAGDTLVEKYVAGREISVAVLDGEALGTIEIKPARPFYDYTAKYDKTAGTQYLFPAPLADEIEQAVSTLAVEAHRALGCTGVTRTDFMVDGAGEAWIIEMNTLPGLTGTSLVPKIAAGRGIEYGELCERLVLGAGLKS